MENILFLQSDKKDPLGFYKRMLEQHPVYYDAGNKIWGLYSAAACREVLKSNAATIPPLAIHPDVSEQVRFILNHLPRLTNAPWHEPLRSISMHLMHALAQPDIPSLFHLLIGEPKIPASFDWVEDVAKKLPVLAILKGLEFPVTHLESIMSEMPTMVKIMAPVISMDEIKKVNESVQIVCSGCSSHLITHLKMANVNDSDVYTANLIGLLIQSYDATRGLLSNALLQILRNMEDVYGKSLSYFQQIVLDALRYDPPVHNTRRILTEELKFNQYTFKQGENILVVLAAGSIEDKELLSYGDGVHRCIAEHFTIGLSAKALHYLFNKYRYVELLEKEIVYEPRINVRLPVKINLMLR